MERSEEDKDRDEDLHFSGHQGMEFGGVVSASGQAVDAVPKSLFEGSERVYTLPGPTTSTLVDLLVKFRHPVACEMTAMIKREQTD